MKAEQMISGASYGPEALKAIGQAFDEAWLEIAGNFGDDPVDIRKARVRLAGALLSIAHEDSRDVGILKQAALERMALDYKRRFRILAPDDRHCLIQPTQFMRRAPRRCRLLKKMAPRPKGRQSIRAPLEGAEAPPRASSEMPKPMTPFPQASFMPR